MVVFMATTMTDPAKTSELGIFARILSDHKQDVSPRLARYFLTLGFNAEEKSHMEDLAGRNQAALLSSKEHDDLMNYVRAGHLLALLHSKARKALRKREIS
jgi:hypothetical protein